MGAGGGLPLEGRAARIAEGLVALANRRLEAGLGGAALEREALLGMAGDAVEEGAERLGGGKPLGGDRRSGRLNSPLTKFLFISVGVQSPSER